MYINKAPSWKLPTVKAAPRAAPAPAPAPATRFTICLPFTLSQECPSLMTGVIQPIFQMIRTILAGQRCAG